MKISRWKKIALVAALVALTTMSATKSLKAQQQLQTPYVVGSTVTGHVFCADTNAPARFAKVVLRPVEGDHSGEKFMNHLLDNLQKMGGKDDDAAKPLDDDKKKAINVASKGMNQALEMMKATTVGMNGEFKFVGVKAGTYYVHAIYAGYIDPLDQFTDEDFASSDPAVRARIAQIPTITVTGTDAANTDVRLERGAAISGRILYDDGSPAVGWTLSAIKPGSKDSAAEAAAITMNQALAMSGAAQVAKTDDVGHFRITGLAAGKYALRASLATPSIGINATNIGDGGSGISLAVYSGSTLSRADAKPIAVSMGEELASEDIMIPSHALHNIVGHVYAKSDGHTLNVGLVTLTSKSNPALHATAAVRDDGSFHFEYLPQGITYTLTVADAADGRNPPAKSSGFMGMNISDPEILRKYGSDTTDVLLGDSDIDSARMTVAQTDWKPSADKPEAATPNLGDVMKDIFVSGSSDKQ